MNRKLNASNAASSDRQGFTLVELLVVVGIIAILIAILLPALNRARARSQQTACMANLRSIGQAMRMYADSNRDKYPDRDAIGGFSYRRKPGLREPKDPSSYPEWKGIAAVLHGIRRDDYNFSMSQAQVQAGLDKALGRKGLYMSGVSDAWICPAFPARFVEYENTYAYTVNTTQNAWTSVQRSRSKNQNVLVAWDNSNFLPYLPGAQAGTSTTGYTTSPAIYPHPGFEGKQRGRNELYFDGRVEMKSP